MKTYRILAIVALVLVLMGFCLPWVDFYGVQSGLYNVIGAIGGLMKDSKIGWVHSFVIFILIPIFSGLCVLGIFKPLRYRILPFIYLIIIDAVLLYIWLLITGVASATGALYGYYIMTLGILLLHILVIVQLIKSRRNHSSALSTSP